MKIGKYTDRYEWLVSYCPEDPDLVGRKFRSPDLQYGTWPEGTIFTNIQTGEVRVWRGGRVVTLKAVEIVHA